MQCMLLLIPIKRFALKWKGGTNVTLNYQVSTECVFRKMPLLTLEFFLAIVVSEADVSRISRISTTNFYERCDENSRNDSTRLSNATYVMSPKLKFPKGAYLICVSKLGERFSLYAIRGMYVSGCLFIQ